MPVFDTAATTTAIPIHFASKATWPAISAALPAPAQAFARANGYAAKPGALLTLPGADGAISDVIFGIEDDGAKSRDLFRPGLLPGLLPPGVAIRGARVELGGLLLDIDLAGAG